MESRFTLIADGRGEALTARIDGESVRLAAADVARILGWEIKPQGLCRNQQCIPLRDPSALADANGVDLAALAETLGRPLALDLDERAGCLGDSARERGAQLASLEAPDFTLPDLSGRLHSLAAQRGKKVLLVAYASW